MKKLYFSVLMSIFMQTAAAQSDNYAWFQNQYDNAVKDFAFYGTHVWVVKSDYVMLLDTISGQTTVFNDFIFPGDAYFGSSTLLNSVIVTDNEVVYVNYYGILNGVLKYDGLSWTDFPCTGFSDQFYSGTQLMINSQQHLFMGKGTELGEFNGNAWQTYSYNTNLLHGVLDSNDTIWLTTANGKLVSFYSNDFTQRLSSGIYYNIAIDDYDNLFTLIGNHEILKFHSGIIDTLEVPLTFSYYNYSNITADSNSFVYFSGYSTHYSKFDGTTWTELNLPDGGYLVLPALKTDDQHYLWIGTAFGFLYKQNEDLSSTAYIVNYSGLPDGGNFAVSSFFFNGSYEPGGFAGSSDGLFEVSVNYHSVAKVDSGFIPLLTDKRINCIEKFGNYSYVGIDTAWFGTNEGLFGMTKNYEWLQFNTTNSPLPNDTINYILWDVDKLMIATNGGVAVYHFNGTWETFTLANSPLPSDHVHSINSWNGGYAFCTSNGVAFYNNPNWKVMNTSNSGLIDNDIQSLFYDYEHYYFGTVAHGICDSSYTGIWNYFNSSNGLPSDSILFITGEYGFGDPVIAGTNGGGILSFENGNYLYNTTVMQGIEFSDATDQTVLSLGEVGEIWILTDKGILYMDFGGSVPIISPFTNGVSAYFAGENLIINFEVLKSEGVQFELYNLNGAMLSRIKTFGVAGKNSVTIPASQLISGVYILKMHTVDQYATAKVLKMN